MRFLRRAALVASLLPAACTGCVGAGAQAEPDWPALRRRMVEQVVAHGLRSEPVLAALRKVPRHEFVPAPMRLRAYDDSPLPIGEGQTISQPFIVAYMTAAIVPGRRQRVLEVGTGSGYQAAVLAELVGELYSIELLPGLARQAEERLRRLGYGRVKLRAGDGYLGWPEAAPFDAIVVTAAAPEIPAALFAQLRPGGKMVIPVGDDPSSQSLRLVEKTRDGERRERDLLPVRFVPLVQPPQHLRSR